MNEKYEKGKPSESLSQSAKRVKALIIFMCIYGSMLLLCSIAVGYKITQSIIGLLLLNGGLISTLQLRIAIEQEKMNVWRTSALAIMAIVCVIGLYAVTITR